MSKLKEINDLIELDPPILLAAFPKNEYSEKLSFEEVEEILTKPIAKINGKISPFNPLRRSSRFYYFFAILSVLTFIPTSIYDIYIVFTENKSNILSLDKLTGEEIREPTFVYFAFLLGVILIATFYILGLYYSIVGINKFFKQKPKYTFFKDERLTKLLLSEKKALKNLIEVGKTNCKKKSFRDLIISNVSYRSTYTIDNLFFPVDREDLICIQLLKNKTNSNMNAIYLRRIPYYWDCGIFLKSNLFAKTETLFFPYFSLSTIVILILIFPKIASFPIPGIDIANWRILLLIFMLILIIIVIFGVQLILPYFARNYKEIKEKKIFKISQNFITYLVFFIVLAFAVLTNLYAWQGFYNPYFRSKLDNDTIIVVFYLIIFTVFCVLSSISLSGSHMNCKRRKKHITAFREYYENRISQLDKLYSKDPKDLRVKALREFAFEKKENAEKLTTLPVNIKKLLAWSTTYITIIGLISGLFGYLSSLV